MYRYQPANQSYPVMPIHPTFIHLRMHSEYSVVDGIVRLDEVVAKAAAEEMPALALTDLCNLFAWSSFIRRHATRVLNRLSAAMCG